MIGLVLAIVVPLLCACFYALGYNDGVRFTRLGLAKPVRAGRQ